MSLRDRRITSSMTAEAKAEADKRRSEGRDPVTGKKAGGKPAPCPQCEVKPPADRKPGGGAGGGSGGTGGGAGGAHAGGGKGGGEAA